tara:strand:- start:37 stop:267 length:231 start_codon:yes stop_codon:yes gene_type:complete
MESVVNFILSLIEDGEIPIEIRVAEPWKSFIFSSNVFSGESPALDNSSILIDAVTGEEHLVVFVTEKRKHRGVLTQ